MIRLKGKVAIVTGGASGLGDAISRRLVEEGAVVVITDVNATAGRALAEEIGGHFLQQDVSNEEQWVETIQQVEDQHGALHILVNNAGIVGPMEQITPENTALSDWQTVQKVNVEGVFLGCRAAIPALKRSNGGAIINISSIAALVATPEGVAYGASKAAVRQLTKSVALYCAQQGINIRCNSVHPGNILTPMLRTAIEGMARSQDITFEQSLKNFEASNPQGKLQDPVDIANAVLFLSSDEARNITGAKLVVDGGTTLSAT